MTTMPQGVSAEDRWDFRDVGRGAGNNYPLHQLRAHRHGSGWPEPYPRQRIPVTWDGHTTRLWRLYRAAWYAGALADVRPCEYYYYAGTCRDRDGFSMWTLSYWITKPGDPPETCRLREHHGNNPEHVRTSDLIRIAEFDSDLDTQQDASGAWERRVHEPEIADALIALDAKYSPLRDNRPEHFREVSALRDRNGCLIAYAGYYAES